MPITGEYFLAAQPGVTLDGLDTISGSIAISAAASGTASKPRLTIAGLTNGTLDLNTAATIAITGATGGLIIGVFHFTVVDATHIQLTDGANFSSTGTGTIVGGIDVMTQPLDSFANALTPEMAQFDTSHQLNWFRGTPMAATLDTAEQGTDGQRLRIRGFRPITDAPTCYGSLVSRETVQATSTQTPESLVNAIGSMSAKSVDSLRPRATSHSGRNGMDLRGRR